MNSRRRRVRVAPVCAALLWLACVPAAAIAVTAAAAATTAATAAKTVPAAKTVTAAAATAAEPVTATATSAATATKATTTPAVAPGIGLNDYNHASWSARDGAPAEVKALAQTPDGWLWLGTTTGLFRFDGVRFERYPLPASELAHHRISLLRAQENGDLWITYMIGGLSVLHANGKFEELPDADADTGTVFTLAPDSDGGVWMAAAHGLYLHARGQLRKFGPEQGVPDLLARSVVVDQYGQVWTLDAHGLYRLDRASGKFRQVLAQANDAALMESPDGRLWLADKERLQPLPEALTRPAGAIPINAKAGLRPAWSNPAESRWSGVFDRDGNWWTQNCPQGLCVAARAGLRQDVVRPAPDATDTLSPLTALSGRVGNAIMEDIEGDIWIATQGGLDRFRTNRLTPARVPLSAGLFSMGGDTEGGVWAVNQDTHTLWRLAPGAPPQEDRSQPFSAVTNSPDGALLLAGRREIERRFHGKVTKIALPPWRDGRIADLDVGGLNDDGKVLWMPSAQTGLMGYIDGHWLPRTAFTLPQRIFLGTVGPGLGQRWHATGEGMLVFNDNGKLTTYDARFLGLVTGISAGKEEVVAGGDLGLAVLRGQGFRLLKSAQPDALVNISGMATTADGDRWFNGAKGVVHVRRDDWRAAVDHDAPLRYELIGALDGYPGQAMVENRLPSLFADRAGQLWFMASGGIVRLAPDQIRRNTFAPAPRVLRVDTGEASYPADSVTGTGLRLPPGSRNLNIQFTAPGLGKPEAMRFQYQLSGVNNDWQEAGGRRTVYYTNLGPGSYSFRVRVWNDDGVPGAREALLEFEIAPTFVQTLWFKLLCALAAAGLLYLLYLRRLRIAVERMAERMHGRMAERERIARTLHDTFLQSVQTIILQLYAATTSLPEDSPARKTLKGILDHAKDTVVEGRDQVHELRSDHLDDVEGAAAEAGRQLSAAYPDTAFKLTVDGARVTLRGDVAEEACEIVREALRNAYQHAGAGKVEARLFYERARFTLQVVDDGKGMDAGAAAKEKHYGLLGMRERAGRVGGRLALQSARGAGTTVTLSVPAPRAYAHAGPSWPRVLLGRR